MAKKILVVDDEADVLKVVKKRLEDRKFEVVTALDGDEGLTKAAEEKPDLIILDVMMPKLDGYTVVRQLKTNPNTRNIPVIILTAKGSGLKDLFSVEGVEDYVTKPYDFEDLLAKVKKSLH